MSRESPGVGGGVFSPYLTGEQMEVLYRISGLLKRVDGRDLGAALEALALAVVSSAVAEKRGMG